ncbi:hypothetical protein [Magnetospirillum fulvum]|uniref:Uncharacterized protein n=1 Tax=Magnetospirillum fulvum MGU-K5 TaxID=1316936 RepID=S9S870_MAGFU|nr:hypothetical protein [Magnetospirillum fulvum]EPY00859.1 hypothetical protein K678_13865 [Magnetospirillum fulvum MGU-K5]
MTDNTGSVGERLAAIHLALGKCCIAWKNLFYTQRPVTLTSDQALEMADFFARTAFEIRDAAALLGFLLEFRKADFDLPPSPTFSESQPAEQAKPRLSVIEGGKSQ